MSTEAPPVELTDPRLYRNRELSWIDFNRRVLAQADRAEVPALERLKFVAIAAANLDEFYMIRVAALRGHLHGKVASHDPSGDDRRPAEILREIADHTSEFSRRIDATLAERVLPELRARGIAFLTPDELDLGQREKVSAHYQREIHPCLTPIAIDPAHPFPHLRNRSVNVALRIEAKRRTGPTPFEQPQGELLALVQLPAVIPRYQRIDAPPYTHAFLALESIIEMHAGELFPGHRIIEARAFRVTRAADLDIVEEDAENLMKTIQRELRRRDHGDAVRLDVAAGISDELLHKLTTLVQVDPRHVHHQRPMIARASLFDAIAQIDRPDLRDAPYSPAPSPELRYSTDVFRVLGERDVLLHHPYDSFQHVIDLVEQAADDPKVVAIKQTLYRTGGNSPIIRALARAAQNGKQVTALVELKARFDEAANIVWAKQLEEAGAHVVYGLLGLKTHSKILLIIRREGTELVRYVHLSTGNYNSGTARQYTDLSLLTADEDITTDAMFLFNVLTGYGQLPPMRRLVVAPFNLRQHVMSTIQREAEHAKAGRPARIIAKMNALVDPSVIRGLYRASRAGVSIDLIVRGICCLRPGVPGVSENIRVRSLIGRYLEHARIAYFQNGGDEEVYLSSADWMPRNLNRRVELSFPVRDPELRRRIRHEILETELGDDKDAWVLGADGTYTHLGTGLRSAQTRFMSLATERTHTERRASLPPPPRASSGGFAIDPVLRVAELSRPGGRRPS